MWTNCPQTVVEAPLAAAVVQAVPGGETPKANGSGDVVDDSFHWMAQYPASVLMQFW